MEWSNSDWVETPTISVSCVTPPAYCESYSVSGSKHNGLRHGKYVASGICDGKPLYECVDCSTPPDFLYYSSKYDDWNIGSEGCGSTVVGLYGSGSLGFDPGLVTQWTESSPGGSEWVKGPKIKVKCKGGSLLNLAAIEEEAVSEASTPSIAMMLIIGMLCGSVVAFLHFLRKQPRKNADETPLLDQGGEAL